MREETAVTCAADTHAWGFGGPLCGDAGEFIEGSLAMCCLRCGVWIEKRPGPTGVAVTVELEGGGPMPRDIANLVAGMVVEGDGASVGPLFG